jgi:integrase
VTIRHYLQPTGRLDLCFAVHAGPASIQARTIAQDAHQAGSAGGWSSWDRLHSSRHTVSAWGKQAGLELEDVKTLLRHEDIATASNVYGDLGMKAKRRIQQTMVEFVRRQASEEASKREAEWPENQPITIR